MSDDNTDQGGITRVGVYGGFVAFFLMYKTYQILGSSGFGRAEALDYTRPGLGGILFVLALIGLAEALWRKHRLTRQEDSDG